MNSVNAPELGLDIDPAAMLLDDDVVGHREAEPGSFSGRLGGEEGIEHLLPDLGRDAGAVVANADFDGCRRGFWSTALSTGSKLASPLSTLRLVAA